MKKILLLLSVIFLIGCNSTEPEATNDEPPGVPEDWKSFTNATILQKFEGWDAIKKEILKRPVENKVTLVQEVDPPYDKYLNQYRCKTSIIIKLKLPLHILYKYKLMNNMKPKFELRLYSNTMGMKFWKSEEAYLMRENTTFEWKVKGILSNQLKDATKYYNMARTNYRFAVQVFIRRKKVWDQICEHSKAEVAEKKKPDHWKNYKRVIGE